MGRCSSLMFTAPFSRCLSASMFATGLSMPLMVLAQAQVPSGAPSLSEASASRPAQVAPASSSSQSAGGWQYMVRSGDTLDRIIAQTQAASPFSIAFLREAFAKLNPSALPRGAQGPLLAGTLLRVPDSAELRRLAFPEIEPTRPPLAAGGSHSDQPSTPTAAQREEAERRSWVRYP